MLRVPASVLSVFLLFVMPVSSHGGTPEQCSPLKDFDSTYDYESVLLSDGLTSARAALQEACYSDVFANYYSKIGTAELSSLKPSIASALSSLAGDSSTDLKVTLADDNTVSKVSFRYLSFASSADAFAADLIGDVLPDLMPVFDLTDNDSFDFTLPGQDTLIQSGSYTVRLQRYYKGVKYNNNSINISFHALPSGAFMLNHVSARLDGVVPNGVPPKPLSSIEMAASLQDYSDIVELDFTTKIEPPHIDIIDGEAKWLQLVPIVDAAGNDNRGVVVDAVTGDVVSLSEPATAKTGEITLPVNRAYDDFESSGKDNHPIPHIDICDNYTTNNGVTVCDTTTFLDVTDIPVHLG